MYNMIKRIICYIHIPKSKQNIKPLQEVHKVAVNSYTVFIFSMNTFSKATCGHKFEKLMMNNISK